MPAKSAASSTARRLALAAGVVARVAAEGRTLEEALASREVSEEDAPALQALAFGTVRWLPRIDTWIDALLDRPGRTMQPDVRALVAVALHQLTESNHPAHAIVDEAVEATRLLRKPRASGFVNALLRRFLREHATLVAASAENPVARFAHPAWLIDAVRADWPEQWARILEENNRQAPLWLRVNVRRTSVERYLERLAHAGIAAERNPRAPEALALAEPRDVAQIPGFAEGEVSVQDAAAQLAAHWLRAQPGERVLDACAAPGGKACHILELTPGIAELVALDIDAQRLGRVRQNLARLGLSATLVEGDARDPAAWWDKRPFERILVDAPCSATGVIRRHPDIKLLRRPADIAEFATLQLALLRSLWPLLAPGGRLLYVTCSILRAENQDVIARFLAETPGAARAPLDPEDPARTEASILPGEAGMDGFHYACLERRKDH